MKILRGKWVNLKEILRGYKRYHIKIKNIYISEKGYKI